MLYQPMTDIGAHPASGDTPVEDPSIKRKERIRRRKLGIHSQRGGYNAERDIFTRLGGIHNPTSQGYDGTITGYRVEYKVRLAGGNVLPTKTEWTKAVAQGNRLVIVEDKVTGEGTVTMSIETFNSIRYDN
ncbi:hypothetical protein [Microcoleus phage My-WqHQDG]|nr:hypothetical protein [Microcoleus phage My-WqHQDG]